MTRSLHMEQHEFPDVDLILNGKPAEYLKNVAGSHGQEGERPLKMNATLLNAVFWGMKPQNNRESKPKLAVFLMDFAPEMLLFLFKNRKNSSLCP